MPAVAGPGHVCYEPGASMCSAVFQSLGLINPGLPTQKLPLGGQQQAREQGDAVGMCWKLRFEGKAWVPPSLLRVVPGAAG